MRDPGRVAGHRRTMRDHVLVGGVARVHQPVMVAEPPEDRQRVTVQGGPGPARRGSTRRPQWTRLDRVVEPRGCEVVVVGQGQVDLVGGEQRSASAGSCSWMSTRSCGWRTASAATIGSSDRRIAEANPATRTEPAGSAVGPGRGGPPRPRRGSSPRAGPTAARPGSAAPAARRARSAARRPPGPGPRSAATPSRWSSRARRRPRASSPAGTVRAAAQRRVSMTLFRIAERYVQQSHVDTDNRDVVY